MGGAFAKPSQGGILSVLPLFKCLLYYPPTRGLPPSCHFSGAFSVSAWTAQSLFPLFLTSCLAICFGFLSQRFAFGTRVVVPITASSYLPTMSQRHRLEEAHLLASPRCYSTHLDVLSPTRGDCECGLLASVTISDASLFATTRTAGIGERWRSCSGLGC
jgi:hypothetical protein